MPNSGLIYIVSLWLFWESEWPGNEQATSYNSKTTLLNTLHILFSRHREINLKLTLKMTFLDTFKSSGKYFPGPGQEKRQLFFQHLLNLTCYNFDLLGKIHARSNNADFLRTTNHILDWNEGIFHRGEFRHGTINMIKISWLG